MEGVPVDNILAKEKVFLQIPVFPLSALDVSHSIRWFLAILVVLYFY